MICYFAPLEGITNALYRRIHHACFPGIDRYFTPFFVPGSGKGLSNRALRELSAAENGDIPLIPQLLCNKSDDFLLCARQLAALSFPEVNLNLGCPSGTVVSKQRGAGFLADPDALRRFLDEVCAHSPLPLSIKTRIGLRDEAEWEPLLTLFSDYPLTELIIHPRLREDYYRGALHPAAFSLATAQSKNPVVYNGDLLTAQHVIDCFVRHPQIKAVMLGRGLLANPALVTSLRGDGHFSLAQLVDFHDKLYAAYRETLFGEKPVLHKMKELWQYMITLFPDHDKVLKRLRKTQHLAEYETAVAAIFRDLSFAPGWQGLVDLDESSCGMPLYAELP